MLTLCTIGCPILFCVIAIVIFKAIYPISKEKLEEQNMELNRLRH